jgi:hypothetical protein
MEHPVPAIGLFGTCGDSKWREPFIEAYKTLGIRYFNPQVADWNPQLADIEAQHLKMDEIILFPVTDETYGTGSLAETGFSILQAITSPLRRYVVVLIAPEPAEHLKADETAYKESVRARRLVRAHLNANPRENVFVVNTLGQMLALSIALHNTMIEMRKIERSWGRVAAA